MSIQQQIDRLAAAKQELRAAIAAKGVAVPQDTGLEGYADYVDRILTGTGNMDTAVYDTENRKTDIFAYADAAAAAARETAQTAAADAASAAQSAAQSYAAEQAQTVLAAGKAYTDTQTAAAQTAAQSYADGRASAAQSAAQSYADGKASAAQSAAQSYADGKLAGCYIAFTDENGQPASEPYIHWNR